ncbi:transposase [Xanthomonas theicola]|nr:transposase [Xanthomonas theicola]
MEAVVHGLRTGGQWKALPKERLASASAIHQRFLEWAAAGFFDALWKGLAEYDQMAGIAWRWQGVDGAMMKAPLAQETVGPNRMDRGKNGQQATAAGGRAWRRVVARGERGQRS